MKVCLSVLITIAAVTAATNIACILIFDSRLGVRLRQARTNDGA